MPHINEKYDFVISSYIVFAGKVLLVYHPRYQMWTPVGGHIELDEDPEEALIREVREEAGLEVEIFGAKPPVESSGSKFLHAPQYVDVHEANPPHKHVGLTYFVRATNNQSVKSDEHSKMRWFSATELEAARADFRPGVYFYAQEAIKFVEKI